MAESSEIDVRAPASTATVLVLFALALEAVLWTTRPPDSLRLFPLLLFFVVGRIIPPNSTLAAAAVCGFAGGGAVGAALSVPPGLLWVAFNHGTPAWVAGDTWLVRFAVLGAAGRAWAGGVQHLPAEKRQTTEAIALAAVAALLPLFDGGFRGAKGQDWVDDELREHVAAQLGPTYAEYELFVVDRDLRWTRDVRVERYEVVVYSVDEHDARQITVEWTAPRD